MAVGAVINGKTLVKAQPVDIPAQDAHTGGVERGGPHICRLASQHGFQPFFQLPSRLVGEGDGNNGPGQRRLHGAQLPCTVLLLRVRMLQIGFQKCQILLRGIGRHFVAVAAAAVFQQIGHPVDQHGGLAAAGTGQQQKRPLGRHDRLALHGVQMGIILLDDRFSRGAVVLMKICHNASCFSLALSEKEKPLKL